MTVMTKPDKTFRLEAVHPKPEEAHTMPYAPAIHIVGACDLMFVSGATSSPLYHKHPHVDEEHDVGFDADTQRAHSRQQHAERHADQQSNNEAGKKQGC